MASSPEKSLGKSKSKSKKPKSKKSKGRIHHTHIEHTDDGGHFLRHSYDQGGEGEEPTPDTTHALGDSSALLGHMQDQFGGELPAAGGQAPGPEAAGAGAAAAPPQGQQV